MLATKSQPRPWTKRLGYNAVRYVCRMAGVAGLGLRSQDQHRLSQMDGALICANHQSFLDPVLIGCAFQRKVNYLARESLFRFPLGPLIQMLDAIPLDRDGLGLSGLKETLRRLRRGEPVLIFPEGTRSHDGEMGPLLPGVCALARRGRAPILPVGIAGTFDAWPRRQWLPSPTVVEVHVGEPIPHEWLVEQDDQTLLHELDQRIRHCLESAERRRANRNLNRTQGFKGDSTRIACDNGGD